MHEFVNDTKLEAGSKGRWDPDQNREVLVKLHYRKIQSDGALMNNGSGERGHPNWLCALEGANPEMDLGVTVG